MDAHKKTALIVIDLMERIVALETAPHAGRAVVERTVQLASAFRQRRGLVVLIRTERRDVAAQPAGSDFVASLAPAANDIVLTKHSWNAFHETELDTILRRQGVKTLVLAGIATNFGVEGTARAGAERGYQLIFAKEAIAGLDAYAHAFALDYVFSRLGRVCSVDEIVAGRVP